MAKKPTRRTASAARRTASKRPAAKAAKSRSGAATARPKAGAKAKAAKGKPARGAAAKPAPRKSAARKPARAKAAPAVPATPQRKILPRRQPETLRCKNLSLSITTDDLERSMRFYIDGLGFHVKDRWEREGRLAGVEIVAGTCLIGLGQDDWAKGRNRTKGLGMRIYLESTQDLDQVAERIRNRGVEVSGPERTSWGARQLRLTDPDGFQLSIYQNPPR